MRGLERWAIIAAVLLAVVVPTAVHGWPTTVRGALFTALVTAAGLTLVGWRTHPRWATAGALGLPLVALVVDRDGWFPDPAIAVLAGGSALLALSWSGRAAWVAGLAGAAYLVPFWLLATPDSPVAALMFTVPPYVAGTALRLRQETAAQLAERLTELEEERELFAAIALRHERARIAGELHDIVGHAVSVMVIQAAAGQRLVETDPDRAREAFAAISESARQGSADLGRLVDLLSRGDGPGRAGPDLGLVEELVSRARGSGLGVTCAVEGDRTSVPAPVARLAFRVVQESLTNALRHAPGAAVRIAINLDEGGGLVVRVENDAPRTPAGRDLVRDLVGTGRGLVGLGERVRELGGQLSAGAAGDGGWVVDARLPAAR